MTTEEKIERFMEILIEAWEEGCKKDYKKHTGRNPTKKVKIEELKTYQRIKLNPNDKKEWTFLGLDGKRFAYREKEEFYIDILGQRNYVYIQV